MTGHAAGIPAKILCVTLSFGGVTPLRVHLMAGFEASSVICVPSGATFNTRLLFWFCDIHVLCRRPWRDGREGGMGRYRGRQEFRPSFAVPEL
jgi:hypothetical protein